MKLNRLDGSPLIGPALCHRAGDIRNLHGEQTIFAEQLTELLEEIDRILDVLEDVKHADEIELVTGKLNLVQETALNLDLEHRCRTSCQLGRRLDPDGSNPARRAVSRKNPPPGPSSSRAPDDTHFDNHRIRCSAMWVKTRPSSK